MRRATGSALLLAVALLVACDDTGEATSDVPQAADTASAADSSAPDGAGDAQQTTTDPTAHDGSDADAGACDEGTIVTIVTGEVVDALGAPVEGARAQACVRQPGGKLVCLRPGEAGEDGRFAQSVPFETQCMAALTLRVLRPPSPFATTYCPLELAPGGSPVLALADPLVLHPTIPAETLPDAGDGQSPLTVAFTGGMTLEVAPQALYFGGSAGWAELAAAGIARDAPGLCALDPSEPAPRHLVAFYPEADVIDASAVLRIPANEALEPGTVLESDVLGGLDCRLADGSLVPEGTWARAGTATVSADGSHVEIRGVPCLTWLRVR